MLLMDGLIDVGIGTTLPHKNFQIFPYFVLVNLRWLNITVAVHETFKMVDVGLHGIVSVLSKLQLVKILSRAPFRILF